MMKATQVTHKMRELRGYQIKPRARAEARARFVNVSQQQESGWSKIASYHAPPTFR
jgi:hypothetical protein